MIVFVLGALSFWILFMAVLTVREARKPMYASLGAESRADADVAKIRERVLEAIERMKKLEV